MAMTSCPSCFKAISAAAPYCPGCGHPMEPEARFRGPPHDCASCGGQLKKGADAHSEGSGCLIALVGLLLAPLLIGIPILLWGLHMASKREGYWQCLRCGSKVPRKIGTFEFV